MFLWNVFASVGHLLFDRGKLCILLFCYLPLYYESVWNPFSLSEVYWLGFLISTLSFFWYQDGFFSPLPNRKQRRKGPRHFGFSAYNGAGHVFRRRYRRRYHKQYGILCQLRRRFERRCSPQAKPTTWASASEGEKEQERRSNCAGILHRFLHDSDVMFQGLYGMSSMEMDCFLL